MAPWTNNKKINSSSVFKSEYWKYCKKQKTTLTMPARNTESRTDVLKNWNIKTYQKGHTEINNASHQSAILMPSLFTSQHLFIFESTCHVHRRSEWPMAIVGLWSFSCTTLWIGFDPTQCACAHDMSNRLIMQFNENSMAKSNIQC